MQTEIRGQGTEGNRNWRLVRVRRLLPSLTMRMAQGGLLVIHAELHGFGAGHTGFSHRGSGDP